MKIKRWSILPFVVRLNQIISISFGKGLQKNKKSFSESTFKLAIDQVQSDFGTQSSQFFKKSESPHHFKATQFHSKANTSRIFDNFNLLSKLFLTKNNDNAIKPSSSSSHNDGDRRKLSPPLSKSQQTEATFVGDASPITRPSASATPEPSPRCAGSP